MRPAIALTTINQLANHPRGLLKPVRQLNDLSAGTIQIRTEIWVVTGHTFMLPTGSAEQIAPPDTGRATTPQICPNTD